MPTTTFNGSEGSYITLTAGTTLTTAFRTAFSTQPQGFFFGSDKLNQVLGQRDCVGIRAYFGTDANGKLTLVLAGAKANTDDMLSSYILDGGIACPSTCGASNGLNS